MAEAADSDNDVVKFWKTEMDLAQRVRGHKQFITRGKKIIKRYRDERDRDSTYDDQVDKEAGKFNILWSNVQTMLPALYAKPPKSVVERRYMDKDPVGRVASMILERAIAYQIDEGYFSSSMRRAVLDRLLPGRGTLWVRYEPTFQDMPSKTQEDNTGGSEVVSDQPGTGDIDTDPAGTPQQEVTYEAVCVDYLDWEDFLTSPARVWEEVRWVRKRVYMTRGELKSRKFKDAENIKLDWTPEEIKGTEATTAQEQEQFRKATVYEIWNKVDRRVIWVAKECDWVLDEKDDPLKLRDFFPCPRPLYATTTNDTLIPVPDYYEYQDQARELDETTARIQSLTKALKAVGCYDASVPELRRVLEEGVENTLIPVANWAAFSEKGGIEGGISWMPLKDIIETLDKLYIAREATKQTLYEITGISDIIRGQSGAGGSKTATEQRIKGQFASLRLNDLQMDVSRFARDTLRLMGEIIAEHFSPMTLFLVSGYEQYAQEQINAEPAPPQNPMMGHNGGPPMLPPPGASATVPADGAVPTMPSPALAPQPIMMQPPQPTPEQKQALLFKDAIQLLRDDKLRGFRIDIETDSMIEPDAEQAKQSATELVTGVLEGLTAAGQVLTLAPEMGRPIGDLLLFAYRKFRVGRSMESQLEEAVDTLVKRLQSMQANPQPSPEEIKAQTEQKKSEAAIAQIQMKNQGEQQKMAMDMEAKQTEHAMEMERMRQELLFEQQRMDIERAKLEMKEKGNQLDMFAQQKKHEIEMEGMAAKERDREGTMKQDGQRAESDARVAGQVEPIIKSLTSLVEKMSKPKNIIRDPQTGRAIGIH